MRQKSGSNIGNGLLRDDTKPLPEPMLTPHWWDVTFTLDKFYSKCPSYLYHKFENYTYEITSTYLWSLRVNISACHTADNFNIVSVAVTVVLVDWLRKGDRKLQPYKWPYIS